MTTTNKPSFEEVMADQGNGPIQKIHPVCVSSTLHEVHFALQVELAESQERLEAMKDQLANLSQPVEKPAAGNRRLAGSSTPKTKLAKSVQELEATIRDLNAQIDDLAAKNPKAFYDVVVKTLPEDEWDQLRAEHPATAETLSVLDPRGADGFTGGVDFESFRVPAVIAALVDPEPTEKVIAYLKKNLSKGEWKTLAILVFNMNESSRPVPKSRLATSTTDGSESD